MLILIDKKIPGKAKLSLSRTGEIIELETAGITYNAISGHPDIFFFQSISGLIMAPGLPEKYFEFLDKKGIRFIKGSSAVGAKYPESAAYNAVRNENYLIHNLSATNSSILEDSVSLEKINVRQGYCRCNLIALKEDHFITSDEAIDRELRSRELKSLYISPGEIILPGFPHGFLGGACGVFENKFFLIGSLNSLSNGEELHRYLESLDYTIIELYNGQVFDGGSILFIAE
ncbi:MAG: DUF6873 family GME fold protein [Ignavibacteria bacterium]